MNPWPPHSRSEQSFFFAFLHLKKTQKCTHDHVEFKSQCKHRTPIVLREAILKILSLFPLCAQSSDFTYYDYTV